jgi:sulfate transport system substrate-binding protein
VPSISIKAEPSVALVDKNAAARGTTEAASAYLEYLYSDVGQRLVAKHHYRASKPELASTEDRKRFPELRLATIEDLGGWKIVQSQFFADGGIFDGIYKPGPR